MLVGSQVELFVFPGLLFPFMDGSLGNKCKGRVKKAKRQMVGGGQKLDVGGRAAVREPG